MPVDAEPKICSRCSKNIKAEGAEYCGRCLTEIIDRRVKRKLGALAASKIVLACDDKNSLQCSVAAYIVKRMKKLPLPIKDALKSKAVVTAKCADEAAADFIWRLTTGSGGNGTLSPESKAATTNIFESVTEKELELYANIKRIKYAKAKSSGLKQKIQKLQAKHPGTLEALAKSGRQLGEL